MLFLLGGWMDGICLRRSRLLKLNSKIEIVEKDEVEKEASLELGSMTTKSMKTTKMACRSSLAMLSQFSKPQRQSDLQSIKNGTR